MRKIKYIVIHCTATPQNTSITSIRKFWKEERGWKNPGYHFIIEANGVIQQLQPLRLPANGVEGHNQNSIHLSYIGGIDKDNKPVDNRTKEQIRSIIKLLKDLKGVYPDAVILGHRDFKGVKKACPSFDVAAWLKTEGLTTI